MAEDFTRDVKSPAELEECRPFDIHDEVDESSPFVVHAKYWTQFWVTDTEEQTSDV